ncbi:hypothetical protein DNTS_025692, partial [Danionella cerebrum]
MSLPANSELCSLERIARYRSACINGSPFAINKPIDIKPRRKWIVTWRFSSDKAEAFSDEVSQAVRFSQATMASESPGDSPLSLFRSSFLLNRNQLEMNSLKGKKRKRWFKSL